MSGVLTINEVADLYRCHPSTIRRAIQKGELESVRVLGVIRVPRTALPAALTVPHSAAAVAVPSAGPSAGVDGTASGAAGSSIHSDAGEQTPAVPTTQHGGSN